MTDTVRKTLGGIIEASEPNAKYIMLVVGKNKRLEIITNGTDKAVIVHFLERVAESIKKGTDVIESNIEGYG